MPDSHTRTCAAALPDGLKFKRWLVGSQLPETGLRTPLTLSLSEDGISWTKIWSLRGSDTLPPIRYNGYPGYFFGCSSYCCPRAHMLGIGRNPISVPLGILNFKRHETEGWPARLLHKGAGVVEVSRTRPLPLRCARVALQRDGAHSDGGQCTAGRAVMLAWCTHTRAGRLQVCSRPTLTSLLSA